jgi:hypothetical protein
MAAHRRHLRFAHHDDERHDCGRFIIYHLLHYTVMVKAVNLTGKDFHAKPEFFDAQGGMTFTK